MTIKELKSWFSADTRLKSLLKERELSPILSRSDASVLSHDDYGTIVSLFDRIEELLTLELKEIDEAQYFLSEEFVSLGEK